MEKDEAKPLHFTSGLIVGTAVAAAAAFLYKTKRGRKVRKVIENYYEETKKHFNEIVKDIKKQAKTKELPQAIEKVVKKKIKAIKKNVFLKQGQPLVK